MEKMIGSTIVIVISTWSQQYQSQQIKMKWNFTKNVIPFLQIPILKIYNFKIMYISD